MSYPTKYSRQYDFVAYQNANPNRPLPADKVNADLNAAAQSSKEVVDFLKGAIRSDGGIANATVGLDQLTNDVKARLPGVSLTANLQALSDLTTTGVVQREKDGSFITGIITIANGGTEAATATEAFDKLAPTTTRGDLIFRNDTTNTRLPAGIPGYHLQTNAAGADPTWSGFLQGGVGATTRTWQDKARDIFSVKDFQPAANGTTDDTNAFSAAAKAATAVALTTNSSVTTSQTCKVFVPAGTYLLSSLVDTGGRSVDWILEDGASITNLTNLNGRIMRESGLRMARYPHYGCYDTACTFSVTANYNDDEPPAVSGLSSNSQISTYAGRDSVAVYMANTAPAALYTLAPLLAPTNGALSATAGGTLAATTYYVRSTWVNASGETLGATETSLAVAANNVLNVAAPASPPTGATGWNVYVSTAAGTETKQNSAALGLTTAWVEPTTGLIAGAALPATNTTGPTYTATTVSCPTFVDPKKLKVGMIIDTAHSPKWSGFITAWASDGSSITVSAWYQNGGGGVGGTPANNVNAIVNPNTKIWAQNSGVTLSASSYGSAAAGYELDVYNSQADSNAYVTGSIIGQTWGFDSYAIGPNKCSAGFVSRGLWLASYVSDNALAGGVGYVTKGAENIGYSYESSPVGGTAFRALYGGSTSFGVTNNGYMNFGRTDAASTTVFNWFSSGFSVAYDARITCNGGTASVGQATLSYVAASHNFLGPITVNASYKSSVSPGAAGVHTLDASSQGGISVNTGSNAIICPTGQGVLLSVVNSNVNFNAGLFYIGRGVVLAISANGSEFVASTTPSAGQSGIGFDGTNYRVYNNTGSTVVYKAASIVIA